MRNPLLIFALRKSTKLSFSALAAASKTLLRAKRAHEKRLKRFSRGGWRCSPFSVHDLAEQVGHSLVGKRPTGAFSDSTRFPLEGERKVPLKKEPKTKGWTTYGFPPSLNDMPLAYRLRYARKSRTAAHLECARLRRILRRTLVPLRPRFSVLRSWLGRTSRPQPYGKIPHRGIF